MDVFHVDEVAGDRARLGSAYLEFLRSLSLSVGLYRIAPGERDPQTPHVEDEVYYVVRGRAIVSVAGEEAPVHAGSIVFVAAEVEHVFHTVTEELVVLVFFAPPESVPVEEQAELVSHYR